MLNGRLASCAGDRSRVYLVVSDGRDSVSWLAVLRSNQGGQNWFIPCVDPDLKTLFHRPYFCLQLSFSRLRFVWVGRDRPRTFPTTTRLLCWWETLLRGFAIDGKPVFDLSDAMHRRRLHEVLLLAEAGQLGDDGSVLVENEESLRRRLKGKRLITDNNMGSEWN